MNPFEEYVPDGVILPDAARRAYAGARLEMDAAAISHALDQLAVRVAVRLQDRLPLFVALTPGGLYLLGALLQRAVFPCRHMSWHVETAAPSARGASVALVHAGGDPELLQRASARLEAGGAQDLLVVTMTATEVSDLAAVDRTAPPGNVFLGCGHGIEGYGENLPQLYVFNTNNSGIET